MITVSTTLAVGNGRGCGIWAGASEKIRNAAQPYAR